MPHEYAWGAQELHSPQPTRLRKLHTAPGILLEEVQTGWVGVIKTYETIGGMRVIGLEDSRGAVKTFPLGFGFLYMGEPVEVIPPKPKNSAPQKLKSRSGSVVLPDTPAKVASASRIWVEGTHDAELVEKIWGHDLRVEGIVVEPMHGIDHLEEKILTFEPGPKRKLGILVDHLLPGTKEERIVADVLNNPTIAPYVLIVGHPYVDIWQSIKPSAIGITSWPQIPRDEEWKQGILRRLGLAHETQADIAQSWKKLLEKVNYFSDVEPSLLAKVEELIDYLTQNPLPNVPNISA